VYPNTSFGPTTMICENLISLVGHTNERTSHTLGVKPLNRADAPSVRSISLITVVPETFCSKFAF
jgi:hypothetical protein